MNNIVNPIIPNNKLNNFNQNKKYLIFWKDMDFSYNGDIYVFDTIIIKEEIYNKNTIIQKFPIPPPFSMWGSPFGHFSQYNVNIFCNILLYQKEKEKYL